MRPVVSAICRKGRKIIRLFGFYPGLCGLDVRFSLEHLRTVLDRFGQRLFHGRDGYGRREDIIDLDITLRVDAHGIIQPDGPETHIVRGIDHAELCVVHFHFGTRHVKARF